MYINDSLRLGIAHDLRDGYEWGEAVRFNRSASDERYDVLCDIVSRLRQTKAHRSVLVEKLVAIAAAYNITLPPEPGECWKLPLKAPSSSGEQMKCF